MTRADRFEYLLASLASASSFAERGILAILRKHGVGRGGDA